MDLIAPEKSQRESFIDLHYGKKRQNKWQEDLKIVESELLHAADLVWKAVKIRRKTFRTVETLKYRSRATPQALLLLSAMILCELSTVVFITSVITSFDTGLRPLPNKTLNDNFFLKLQNHCSQCIK